MEFKDSVHKTQMKQRLFADDQEVVPAPQRAKHKRSRWFPLLLIFLVVVILSSSVLVYLHVRSNSSKVSQIKTYHWCVSHGATLAAQAGASALNSITAVASNDAWTLGTLSKGDINSNAEQNMLLVEHWNGTAWNTVSTPDTTALLHTLRTQLTGPTNEETSLNALAVVSPTNLWAVGDIAVWQGGTSVGQTLIEHWDGQQWRIVPSPDGVASGNNSLHSVAAISANDIWAVGVATSLADEEAQGGNAPSTPLVEHWDGKRWSIVPFPSSLHVETLSAVSATASNDIWAVGMGTVPGNIFKRAPFVIHWNGQQWSTVALPSSLGLGAFSSLAVISPNDVWVVGQGTSTPNGASLALHWDGHHWNTVTFAREGWFQTITAQGAQNIWAVGSADQPLLEHWDGQQWHVVPLQAFPTSNTIRLSSVTVTGEKIWLAGIVIDETSQLTSAIIMGTC